MDPKQEMNNQAPVNLTVSRVNTSRSAPSAPDVSTTRAFDFPWTPDTGKGSFYSPLPLLSPSRSSLPLFQPSPRGTPSSHAPQQFSGLSVLEAMLQSPVHGSGDGDILMGSDQYSAFRFDTPNTRAALMETIFSTTPRHRADSQPQMHSSESKSSQRGFVDLHLLQSLAGQGEQQLPQSSQVNSGLKQGGIPASVSEQQPLGESPAAANFMSGGQPSHSNALQDQQQPFSAGLLSPRSLYMMHDFAPDQLNTEATNHHLYHQQQPFTRAPGLLSPLSLPTITPLSAAMPGDTGLAAEGLGSLHGLSSPDLGQTLGDGRLIQISESETSQDSGLPPPRESESDTVLGSQGADPVGNKSCHCKKSQCLKLYCDCFAAGLFCANCACTSCMNKPEHGSQVMEKRDNIMTRDPEAFSKKIQVTGNKRGGGARHKKGCNCRRSSCLKKYCECFQGGVKCASHCKCLDCKNLEDAPNRDRAPGASAAATAADATPAPPPAPTHAAVARHSLEHSPSLDIRSHDAMPPPASGRNLDVSIKKLDLKRAMSALGAADSFPASEPTIAYDSARSGELLRALLSSPEHAHLLKTPSTVSSKALNHQRLGLPPQGRPQEYLSNQPDGAPEPVGPPKQTGSTIFSEDSFQALCHRSSAQQQSSMLDPYGLPTAFDRRHSSSLNPAPMCELSPSQQAKTSQQAYQPTWEPEAAKSKYDGLAHIMGLAHVIGRRHPGGVTPGKKRHSSLIGQSPENSAELDLSALGTQPSPSTALGQPNQQNTVVDKGMRRTSSLQLPSHISHSRRESVGGSDTGDRSGATHPMSALQAAKQSAFDYIQARFQSTPGGFGRSPSPGRAAAPAGPEPMSLLGLGRTLSVRTSTPPMTRLGPSASGAAFDTASASIIVTPTSGKDGVPSLEALLMSDFDLGVQFAHSPLCVGAQQVVSYNIPTRATHKNVMHHRFSPGGGSERVESPREVPISS